ISRKQQNGLITLGLIFHERQEGQLCAQHALNGLLQGPYFTAVDLSSLGKELDDKEMEITKSFLKDGSYNMDDSGFFSVQVMEKALEVWNLRLSPITSQENAAAREDPAAQQAFILNFQEHCTKNAPSHVSETYLALLLKQFESDGYSVFVVEGQLPPTEETPKPVPGRPAEGADDDLAKAIALSLGGSADEALPSGVEDYDAELERAILESLPAKPAPSASKMEELSIDEVRRRRLEMFQKK
ncbi:Josephin-domain-containing protein, partial [Chytridium lagenaria]